MTDNQLRDIAEMAQRTDGQPNQTMRDMARELLRLRRAVRRALMMPVNVQGGRRIFATLERALNPRRKK